MLAVRYQRTRIHFSLSRTNGIAFPTPYTVIYFSSSILVSSSGHPSLTVWLTLGHQCPEKRLCHLPRDFFLPEGVILREEVFLPRVSDLSVGIAGPSRWHRLEPLVIYADRRMCFTSSVNQLWKNMKSLRCTTTCRSTIKVILLFFPEKRKTFLSSDIFICGGKYKERLRFLKLF